MLLERKILQKKAKKNKTKWLFTMSFKVIKEFKIKVNFVSSRPIFLKKNRYSFTWAWENLTVSNSCMASFPNQLFVIISSRNLP